MTNPAPPEFSQIKTAQDFAARFDVSRETLAQLTTSQALLGKWQKSVNLVGPATLDLFWSRHAADSYQVLEAAPDGGGVWLDLGSGAGFPGLVAAIGLRPRGARVHLVESDRKKAGFLRAVIREIGAPATVHNCRIEALAADRPASLSDVSVITARALASLAALAPLMQPFFNSSTVAVLHKGRDWQEELTQCHKNWNMQAEMHVSQTDEAARIIQISQLVRRVDGSQPAAFRGV